MANDGVRLDNVGRREADVGLRAAAAVGARRAEDGLQFTHQGGRWWIGKDEAVEDALRPGSRGRAARIRVEAVHRPLSAEIGLVVGSEGGCQVDEEAMTSDLQAFDLACRWDRELGIDWLAGIAGMAQRIEAGIDERPP